MRPARNDLGMDFTGADRRLKLALRTACAVALICCLSITTQPARAADGVKEGKGNVTEKKSGDSKKTDEKAPNQSPIPRHFRVKDLDGGHGWLNTSGEMTIQDLRGKIVILDFWTYCCINCMHILPELKMLEQKFPNQLVVIGIHSAKFPNEKETENIRQAIMRYEIEHPVINDSEMTLWKKFGAKAWPTIGFIDPEGYFLGNLSGEFEHTMLANQIIAPLIAYHRKKGTLDETPVDFHLEREKADPTPLRYPGKVLADAANDRLYISDSNHNRIVVTTLAGELIETIGTGAIGTAGGGYDRATFDHPQGMALTGELLYVADTENHMIRKIDLAAKNVSTLVGTGEQDRRRTPRGEFLKTPLNSPWALEFLGGKLYIAMAGPHQMWVLDEAAGTVKPYAGSGRENITDGPLLEGTMAQPSGVATDGKFLYVADSEASAVRKIDLDPKGKIRTFIGKEDGGLFHFGDRDGTGDEVLLQHPLGIALSDGKLYVADSYNHKIKIIDIATRECKTLLGTGKPGLAADPPQFSEPAGLAVAGNRLYIADTNNHVIRVADLQTGSVTTLVIAGLKPPKPPKPARSAKSPKDNRPPKDLIALKPFVVQAGAAVDFAVTMHVPEGYKLNKRAPITYRIQAAGKQNLIATAQLGIRKEATAEGRVAKFSVPLSRKTGSAELLVSVTYQFCRDGVGGLCKIRTVHWSLPLEIQSDAKNRSVELEIAPK